MAIRGIDVVLINKTATSEDGFGNPVYEETRTVINNVLVSPTSTQEVTDQLSLTGRKAVYTLAIPKGDQNIWEDQYVEFFGKRFHVFSSKIQGIEHMIPLDWNAKVYVEIYEW